MDGLTSLDEGQMNGNIYFPQSAYLKNIIRSIWYVDGYPGYHNEIIIPKGIVEIIFDFGETGGVQARMNDKSFQLTRCFITGFQTYPLHLQLPEKHSFFGVQFHPGVIKGLFGTLAREFVNRSVDLTLVDPFYDSLWHQLAGENSFLQRVAVISHWIEGRRMEIPPQEKLMNHFLGNPYSQAVTVPELARKLCYSQRHLSRKIYELTEMNTEEMLLYKKYLHSVQLIHSGNLSLTEIAFQSRFADQSHFIKSFKTYAHLTPGEYRQVKSQIPGHIYENVRYIQL